MVRKPEYIRHHPRDSLGSLGGFVTDTWTLLSVTNQMIRWLSDDNVAPADVVKQLLPQLQAAAADMEKWREL